MAMVMISGYSFCKRCSNSRPLRNGILISVRIISGFSSAILSITSSPSHAGSRNSREYSSHGIRFRIFSLLQNSSSAARTLYFIFFIVSLLAHFYTFSIPPEFSVETAGTVIVTVVPSPAVLSICSPYFSPKSLFRRALTFRIPMEMPDSTRFISF